MNKIALFLIKLYCQLTFYLPRHCIYIPSCSLYAQEAFSRYPFTKALILSFKRILKCHPFAGGGYDPLK